MTVSDNIQVPLTPTYAARSAHHLDQKVRYFLPRPLISNYRDILAAIETVEGIEGVLTDIRRRAEYSR